MVPQRVLAAYRLEDARVEAITLGHINLTYRVDSGSGRFVLQRLHPVFDAIVHEDIEAVTHHLARAGLTTPRLCRTQDGTLWTTDDDARPWRLMTYVDGLTHLRVTRVELGVQAGSMLGRFHEALRSLEHRFRAQRLGVHDTAQHIMRLREALQTHAQHVAYGSIEPLANAILHRLDHLGPVLDLPKVVVHGDPKISNFLFDASDRALCLIDLDTVARMNILHELGDAFRSWCSPAGEADPQATFDAEIFAAALAGYRARSEHLRGDALRALPHAVEAISLGLAARFARDALEERYFAWDKSRFEHAWQHHLLRAQSQLALAHSIAAQQQVLLAQCA